MWERGLGGLWEDGKAALEAGKAAVGLGRAAVEKSARVISVGGDRMWVEGARVFEGGKKALEVGREGGKKALEVGLDSGKKVLEVGRDGGAQVLSRGAKVLAEGQKVNAKVFAGGHKVLEGGKRALVSSQRVLENADSSSSSEEDEGSGNAKRLEEERWFHGFLPAEQLLQRLRIDGDFGLRYSLDSERRLLLYVSTATAGIKIYIVQTSRTGTIFVEKREFESVGDLVRFHLVTETPVVDGSGVILRKGVRGPKFELANDDVDLTEAIGEGEFGQVYRGVWKDKPVAVKENKDKTAPAVKAELLNEAMLLFSLRSPYVVRCYGVAVKRDPLYVVLELVERGSLLAWLRGDEEKTPKTKQRLLRELLEALVYLESRKVVQRDVAARNCLLDKDLKLKLADFGHAIHLDDAKQRHHPIAVRWTAPEVLASETFSFKSDVWSFGIVAWETVADGAEPWPGRSTEEVRADVQAGRRMTPAADTPHDVARLMDAAWTLGPDARPTATQLLALLCNESA